MLAALSAAQTEGVLLLAVTIALLGLLAPFFIWVNIRGLRRENRRNLERLQSSLDELVASQRRINKVVEAQSDVDRQKN